MPVKIEWLALLTLIFATNFSPGPVTITTMSLAILYGIRHAIKFCAGVFVGYSIMMLFTAFAADTLMTAFPAFETVIRIVGALYIGWLGLSTLRKSLQIDVQDRPPLGFMQGLLMQFVNVKGMLFGLMLFSSLLSPLQARITWQVLGAVGMGVTAFAATVTYSAFGSVISRYMSDQRIRRAVSILLSLALFYVALRISGLLEWMQSALSH